MAKWHPQKTDIFFAAAVGNVAIFIFCQKKKKKAVEKGKEKNQICGGDSNVEAVVNDDCHLLSPGTFPVRISMAVLIARSPKTPCLALFIPQLQEPYAAEPH